MATGSGEPEDDVVRAEAGPTSTTLGPALARAPPFPAEVPPAVAPNAAVVLDAGAVDGAVVDPDPLGPVALAFLGDVAVDEADELPPAPVDAEAPAPDPEDWPPAENDVVPAPPPGGEIAEPVVVVAGGAGAAVGVVTVPPAGAVLVARTCVGVNVGFPVPEVPVTLVPPNTQAVTLPGGGLYVMAPSWL